MLCSNPASLLEVLQTLRISNGGSMYIHSLGELLEGLTRNNKLDYTITYLKEHLNIDDSYKAVVFSLLRFSRFNSKRISQK